MSFGPGSIIDMPNRESYMVLGPDHWMDHTMVFEKRLADKLKVTHFGSPKKKWDGVRKYPLGIPVRDFPFDHVCPRCGHLSTDYYCKKCKGPEEEKGQKTMPPRLVAACERGHIQDFPWWGWIGRRAKCNCKKKDLYLIGNTTGNNESDLKLRCAECDKETNLIGALGKIDFICSGKRPWLGDSEKCEKKLYGLMRGASNVYFPIRESALSIPPFSNTDIQPHTISAFQPWKRGKIRQYIQIGELQDLIDMERYTEDEMVKLFDDLFQERKKSIKAEEWDTLIHCDRIEYDPKSNFYAVDCDISGVNLNKWFEKVVLVKKLREVIAITSFTRIQPYNSSDQSIDLRQPIRMQEQEWKDFIRDNPEVEPNPGTNIDQNWVPGVEMFGEGLFFQFNRSKIDEWRETSGFNERVRQIITQGSLPHKLKDNGININDPAIILIHTFSHLFIRRMAMSCGYPTPSIRERLYLPTEEDNDLYGVMIYIATTDQHGTLGGLIARGEDVNELQEEILEMINDSRICSQDPLCRTHNPIKTNNPWGASCHSCSYLPETSCEGLGNKLLDRQALWSYFK